MPNDRPDLCCNCDGDDHVTLATVDLDITPVPLCLLCRLDLNWMKDGGSHGDHR